MKHFLTVYFTIMTCLAFSQTPNRTVNFTSTVAGASKFTSITTALSGAASGTTIWVAAGTYTEAELIIPAGVTVIGGFPPNATTYEQRIYPGVATKTQLSILNGQYKHRLATVSGTLDGFKITKGYAFSNDPNDTSGGGVLINGGTVQNCILINNTASYLDPTDSTNIPGEYVASIGDIYCIDGTILSPTYRLDQTTGKIEATLPGGIPTGKIPQGIIYNIDKAATTRRIYIMAKVSSNQLQFWFDRGNIGSNEWPDADLNTPAADVLTVADALKDFSGAQKSVIEYNYYDNKITTLRAKYPWYSNSAFYSDNRPLYYTLKYNTPSDTQGQWYLPAAGELYKIWEVYPQMDACARDVLGWITSSETMFIKGYYWSSTEYDANDVWILSTNGYPWGTWGLIKSSKSGGGYTIPVTALTVSTE